MTPTFIKNVGIDKTHLICPQEKQSMGTGFSKEFGNNSFSEEGNRPPADLICLMPCPQGCPSPDAHGWLINAGVVRMLYVAEVLDHPKDITKGFVPAGQHVEPLKT